MKSKNYICHAPYLTSSIACDHDFCYTCVKWWYVFTCFFSIFSKFWFWNKAKNGPKWQKILSRFVSQEPYIWFSFMPLVCKMIMSLGVFLFFHNFNFFTCWWGKRAKTGPKWQKILSVMLHISGTINHMIFIYVVKWYLQVFFSFFHNFDFLDFLGC